MNECLSTSNLKLLSAASSLKKEKKLFSVFTLRGLVHVKVHEDDRPFRVENLQSLVDATQARPNEN